MSAVTIDLPEGKTIQIIDKPAAADVRIVVLQRGHVAVGLYSRNEYDCVLEQASIIRQWGTTKGLGELTSGPTSKTVLDRAGRIEFHRLTTILEIPCEAAPWLKSL